MTEFKVGDVVRVVMHPSGGWWDTGQMSIGREFAICTTFVAAGKTYAADSEGFCIPLNCIELTSAPKQTDGWQPWNPPSEDTWPKARSKAADKRRLDAKFGPRPQDEWDD